MQEKIVEIKTCKACDLSFEITDKDAEFYEKVSPVFDGKKFIISTPNLCPDCRMQQRYSWRNERKLYHRKCDLTGNQIISIYSPDKPYKIYNIKDWNSDKWDAMDYHLDFDFSRSFFEQFSELMIKVPKVSMFATNNENSDYTNGSQQNKNCYMIFVSDHNEDCFYSYGIFNCKNVIESTNCSGGENLIECVDCYDSFNLKYCQNTYNSSNSYFLYDSKDCHNCIGCFGLRNKSYCILNKQYTKDEYNQEFKKLDFSNTKIFRKLDFLFRENIKKQRVNLYYNGNNNDNVAGDYILNSKNIQNSFDSGYLEDCKNIVFGFDSKNCFDGYVVVDKSELCYQIVSSISQYKCFSTFCSWYSSDSFYLDHCVNCSNCFACSGLKNKSYCILNKQYTKEEYNRLVPNIIEHMQSSGEWGEFFPSSLSPFGYNETVAQEYFPLTPTAQYFLPPDLRGGEYHHSNQTTENESKIYQFHYNPSNKEGKGTIFNWSDYEKQNGYIGDFYEPLEISEYNEEIVGKDIAQTNIDNLLKGILSCEITKKPYRIIKEELEFYRKHNLPIPKRHPDQRHLDRMKLRNPRKLYKRECDKCKKQIQTTYSPEREEMVYCQTCYESEIY